MSEREGSGMSVSSMCFSTAAMLGQQERRNEGSAKFPSKYLIRLTRLAPGQSARGLAHSKTLARLPCASKPREASWSAADLRRFAGTGYYYFPQAGTQPSSTKSL